MAGHPLPNGLPRIPGAKLLWGGPIKIKLAGPLPCLHCGELIDMNVYVLNPRVPYGLHPECAMRAAVGSVGHQTCRCSCFGGDYDDPPGMTRREGALAAWRLWEARRDGRN